MKLSRNLLSGRFRTDGKASISVGAEGQRALAYFIKDVANGKIALSSHAICPLCGADSGTLIGEKDRLGIPCRTVVCENCGLVFNDSFLDEDSSAVFYEKYWRQIQWGDDPEKNFELRTGPDAYSWKRLAYVALNLEDELKKIDVVVEPGCGDGCNLLPYHLLGKDVVGCDYDAACLEAGRRTGMRLIKGGTGELLKSGIKADLVILSHVVEHFIDVDSELKRINEILGEDGYVSVEVPGIRNWNRPRSEVLSEDGFRSTNDFLGYLQFQHNYHFELHTLRQFFERNDFEFITGDEWVRAIFRHAGNSRGSYVTRDYKSSSNIVEHLKAVERDYLCVKNRLITGGRAGLTWLKNYVHF